jgi:hypothetical protein
MDLYVQKMNTKAFGVCKTTKNACIKYVFSPVGIEQIWFFAEDIPLC